jgi:acyl-CoA dehydrogenase
MLLWIGLDQNSPVLQAVFALLLLVTMVPLLFRPLRRKLISNKLFSIFRQATPTMSASEKEALDAGSIWWDAELFTGRPDWKKLLTTPAPSLTEEERQFIDGPVAELCSMIDDWKITHQDHDLSAEVWDYIRSNGFFAIIIPREFGGLGFSALAHSTIVMKIASRSVTAAVTVMVPNSLGPAELLLHYGTDEQRNYYLPRLAAGKEIPCFALTGPDAGSDASSIPDTGIVCRGEHDGQKDVIGIRLNWEKRYITLGPVATLLGLAFHLYDPDHIVGEQEDLGITLALVPTNTAGVEIGHRHNPLDIAFMNGPNRGKDVFIPMDWIIGGQARMGQGWRMLMESLATGRSISLPALSTGAGKLASRATGAYARIRRQFKQPIGNFEGIEEALTRIAAHTYQMDAVRQVTAGAIDQGHSPSVLSAIAKYNLTEKMRIVINDAMDIQAGSAICLGPRNIIARIYQSIPISITVEGANILTRSMIIFGQGAIRSHPYIHAIMKTANTSDPERAAKDFDRLLFRQIRFFLSNIARSLFSGLTQARLLRTPVQGEEAQYYRQLSRMSTVFALLTDTFILTLGAQLKRKEKISARLADILSELYIASCVLKHYQDQGSHQQDYPFVQWACDSALNKIQSSTIGLLQNYPYKPVAWLLKKIIFPLGTSFVPASDKLGSTLAAMLLEPCPSRSRLTQDIYIPHNTNDTLGRIESALTRVIVAEPVEATIKHAIKQGLLAALPADTLAERAVVERIITQEQAEIVHAANQARRDVIMVDEFSKDLKQHFDPVSGPLKNNNSTLTPLDEVHDNVS